MYAILTTLSVFATISDVSNVGSYEGRSRRRLTAREKVARDAEIVSDWIRGLGWQALAVKHGVQERQCRNIVRDWQADQGKREEMQAPGSFGSDPLEVVEEFLLRYAAIERELAELAAAADNDN